MEKSRQVQLRRGTATEHETFIGAVGELTVDTTNNTLRVHDGITPGGTPVARAADIPTSTTGTCYAPDYNNIIDNVGNNYTAPCPGIYWFACPNSNSQRTIYINEYGFNNVLNSYGARGGYQITLDTGDTICIDQPSQTLDYSYFIPFKSTEIL